MSKQWGHGFHKGEKVGHLNGQYDHANGKTRLAFYEKVWAASCMASKISETLYSENSKEFENLRYMIVALDSLYVEARNIKIDLDKTDQNI